LWRKHGVPICLGPYSDRFADVTVELEVASGTSSLDIVLAANLKSGVELESFGLTKFKVEVLALPTNDNQTHQAEHPCEYAIENDFWYEIKSHIWQADKKVTMECANGKLVHCKDWFNRYACQVPSGDCPAPRRLSIAGKCCSLGKSCDQMNLAETEIQQPEQASEPASEKCEYLYNKIEDLSFVDIRVSDMTKTVQLECADGTLVKCTANQWGKHTCSLKTGQVCPEPRNAVVNGQCCNLGKGCALPARATKASDLEFTMNASNQQGPPSASPTVVISVAVVCGLIAVVAVIAGAVLLQKRSQTQEDQMARLP